MTTAGMLDAPKTHVIHTNILGPPAGRIDQPLPVDFLARMVVG